MKTKCQNSECHAILYPAEVKERILLQTIARHIAEVKVYTITCRICGRINEFDYTPETFDTL